MSGDPGQFALDGRADGDTVLPSGVVIRDNQVLPWRPVELGRRVTASRDRKVARLRGTLGPGNGGPDPSGKSWDTPSNLDQQTWLTEDITKNYVDADGKDWTLHDMVTELFIDLQARRKAAGGS